MLNSPTCCILPPNAFYGRPNASRKDYQLLYGLDDTSINRSIISYWPNGHSYDGFTENFYASPSLDRENDRGFVYVQIQKFQIYIDSSKESLLMKAKAALECRAQGVHLYGF